MNHQSRSRPTLPAILILASLATTAAASEFPAAARLSLQPETPAAAPASDTTPPADFGAAGSWWWTLGGSFADDFSNNQDFGVYASVRHFIVDDWEFGGQLNLRYIKQKGEDAVGLNPVMIIRYHFYKTENWTIFGEAGIGFMVTTDTVPDGSTSFNFTPRAGLGVTRRLNDAGVRLEAGLTWMHISNARIQGDRNNESRDAPQIYAGVIFPF